MTEPAELRRVAHDALALTEPPYLKHYRGARFTVWNGVAFTTSALPGPGFNFAAVLRPDVPALDDLLPVARAVFAHCEQGWGVQVEGDAGHPMEAELRDRGWAVAEDEPAFVLETLTPAVRREVPPGLVIRTVPDQVGTDAFHDLVGAAFGAPPDLAGAMRPLPTFALDPDIALFVGSVDGVDVTAAGYSRSGPTAVLWGVATLEAYRGRGYGSAVSRAALAHAAARSCTNAALRSGPKSIPLYERLGFRYVCQHRTYQAPA
jgi:GNAT superfamily N-acetyltransferase